MSATLTPPRTAVIRQATGADVPHLVEMARHFVAQTDYAGQVPDDLAHLTALVEQLLSIGVVFVADDDEGRSVGMLAGLVYPHYMTGRLTANETAWWVEPTARGGRLATDLLDTFERWATAQGATVIEIGAWHPRLERFYRRLGYVGAERIFRKDVSPC